MDMSDASRPGSLDAAFVGRQAEMEWLFDRFRRRRYQEAVVVAGPPGIGKTTLVHRYLAQVRTSREPLILASGYEPKEALARIDRWVEEQFRDKNPPEIVVIEDADAFDDRQLNAITGRVLNFKAVRQLIFVRRTPPKSTRADVLNLEPLSRADADNFLTMLMGDRLPPDMRARAAEIGSGSPLALQQLAKLIVDRDLEESERLIRGDVYDVSRQVIIHKKELITEVKPRIILANQDLIERLRREPDSIYTLTPRKFEELIADLLADLGYDVELTPATRDGGKDILAYMTTPHGKLLCLVEAKKHRRDRPVGVELVRQLYGTLTDADANSAMLVTTSSFSKEAKAFQKRHQYKLALRDYTNIIKWIEDYKKD
jgi:HJR/Mrr/RecB family endonuclease